MEFTVCITTPQINGVAKNFDWEGPKLKIVT